MYSRQLNYSTKSDQNMQIISGSLVLSAIKDTLAKQKLTSATVLANEKFNLTRTNLIFEIRASLPTSKRLSGKIMLIPERDTLNNTIDDIILILDNFNFANSFSKYDRGEFQIYRFQSMPDMNFSTQKWSIYNQEKKEFFDLKSLPFNKTISIWQGEFRLVLNLFIEGSQDSVTNDKNLYWPGLYNCS